MLQNRTILVENEKKKTAGKNCLMQLTRARVVVITEIAFLMSPKKVIIDRFKSCELAKKGCVVAQEWDYLKS